MRLKIIHHYQLQTGSRLINHIQKTERHHIQGVIIYFNDNVKVKKNYTLSLM